MRRSSALVIAAALVAAGLAGPPARAAVHVLVGAGDIAGCSGNGDEATADLLDDIEGTIFTTGDNAYPDGTPQEFDDCYDPSWGRHRERTKPSPGNHDWHTENLAGYLGYFAGQVPANRTWYSYDLGAWHIISLDSMCNEVGGCHAGSPQETWLRQDLAATDAQCIAAYWHHPRFSSGNHGSDSRYTAFWEALLDHGADVVLNGHDHNYERFAPQDAQGDADVDGIRQFVVGTGGRSLRSVGTAEPNSVVRSGDAYGVLELTLRDTSFDWRFVPVPGETFTDSGSATCGTDVTPPQTQITAGPPATTASSEATFSFTADEPGSTFACRLDGGAFVACSSPARYGGLASGEHTFEVRATDAAGNPDPSPATWRWTIRRSTPSDRPFGDTEVFARVGEPGMPEGIAVRDGVVYVSTHTSVRGNAGGPPSKIFRYDLDTGALLGEIVVQGQDLSVNHGLLALAFDAHGRLYAVDRNPGRILRFDLSGPAPVQTTYATIPDLPACPAAPPCSPTRLNQPTFADYLTFGPDGSMYVTDLEAATIFRVRPAGSLPRAAEVWFQDPRLDSIFGPNGIQVGPDGMLYFAMTGSIQPDSPAQGLIYRLPLGGSPQPDQLEVFHRWLEPAAGPDGIAFGAGGRLYVALTGINQISVLDPFGAEVARFPNLTANPLMDPPYDLPASLAFDGRGSLLVTNQSFFTADPDHWVVFDVWVDDPGAPPIEPSL